MTSAVFIRFEGEDSGAPRFKGMVMTLLLPLVGDIKDTGLCLRGVSGIWMEVTEAEGLAVAALVVVAAIRLT